jgi:hypothetical protein
VFRNERWRVNTVVCELEWEKRGRHADKVGKGLVRWREGGVELQLVLLPLL